MNPQPVTYHALERGVGVDIRGYVAHQYTAGVDLEAQVTWLSLEQRAKLAEFGELKTSQAKLLFRMADLTAAGVAPQNGDQFSLPGSLNETARLTILEVRPHSPLRGGFLLVDIYLGDEGEVAA